MGAFVFRLQVLLDRRIEVRKKAEESVVEREKVLQTERKTMRELEAATEAAAARYELKRVERSMSGRNNGLPILNQENALRGLKLDVQAARSSVLAQQIFVDQALEQVKDARKVLEGCRREEDVLEKFREKAQERFLQEASYKEELEQDEIGNVMHLNRRERK